MKTKRISIKESVLDVEVNCIFLTQIVKVLEDIVAINVHILLGLVGFVLMENFYIKSKVMEKEMLMAAIENADKRLTEIANLNFAISAKADYYNGLTQGFKDGAK